MKSARVSGYQAAHVKRLALGLCLTCAGCSYNQHQVNDLATELQQSDATATLVRLEALNLPQRDRAWLLLSKGQLKLLSGDFLGSISDLQSAKQLINSLQALSVSETLGASTINETLRTYTGTPAERVLLQELLALNYLLISQPESARIEILQADVLMRQLAERGADVGQVASTRYLGGLVFELHRDWDDALISYRKAAEILAQRGIEAPPALKQKLLILSRKMGLAAEHDDYVARFGFDAPALPDDQGEVILLYWQGKVSNLRQQFISVYAPELKQQVSVAMPYYPQRSQWPLGVAATIAGQQRATAVIEDIDNLARADLKAQRGAILAATLVRIVAKQQAVSAAHKENPNLGALLNLGTTLSEVADVRSWNMLPSNIQVLRLTLPLGDHSLSLNAGSWQTSVALRVDHDRPCIILATDINRQLFNNACLPNNNTTGML